MRGHLSTKTRLHISITRMRSTLTRCRLTIKHQTSLLKEKDRTIAALEAKLTNKETERKELLTYLYKPGKKDQESKPRGKKPGSPAYHRPIPLESAVTQEYTYTLKQCPICKDAVGRVVDTVVKYTEDIALKPRPLVTKHTITRHWCSKCETYVKSPDVPPITRIGIKTMGYALYARYRLRLPIERIRESLADLYDFKISEGEIVALLKDSESLFGKDYAAISVLVQEARAVYADETGWRMDGENWWLGFLSPLRARNTSLKTQEGKECLSMLWGRKKIE
jgi:hypothetical protein